MRLARRPPGYPGYTARSSCSGPSGEVGFHEAGVTHSRRGGRDDGTGPHGGRGGQVSALTPSRLVIARKRRGLTLTQLAGLTGLSTRSISLYENGHTEPSEDTLRQLALVLDVSPGFLRAAGVDEIPQDAVSFRALSKMTARERDRALSAGRVALLINDWIDARFRLPDTDIPGLAGHDPEAAADSGAGPLGAGRAPGQQRAASPGVPRGPDLLADPGEHGAGRVLAVLAGPAVHLPGHGQVR